MPHHRPGGSIGRKTAVENAGVPQRLGAGMAPTQAMLARAIRKRVDVLCRELRPAALGLMEAFAIPDEVLAAPIAT